jgi:hypothetical protein
LFYTGGQTNMQTDTTKLIVVFRNFANVPIDVKTEVISVMYDHITFLPLISD